jgi:WD40 repeat protein
VTRFDSPDQQRPPPQEPLVYTLTGHGGAIRAVAVTPDSKRAVSASDDTTLKLWDLERGLELATMTGHATAVWSVAITPDGKYAISGSSDGTLKMWDLELGRDRATMTGHAGIVWSIAVTPDSRHAVSGSTDGTLKVWDLKRGQESRTIWRCDSSICAVAVTPDGKWVVAGTRDGTANLWELVGGSIRSLTVVPRDSEQVSRQPWLAWELHTAPEFTILVSDERARAVTPDGKRMVEARGLLTVRDVAQDRIRATRTGHSGKVWAVAVAPDGKCAVSGGHDRTLRVWDLERVLGPPAERQPLPSGGWRTSLWRRFRSVMRLLGCCY